MMNAMVTDGMHCRYGLRAVLHRHLSCKLRDLHRRWMDETSQWLIPALAPDADFWNGWSAVRYINDQFDRQYRRKCAPGGCHTPAPARRLTRLLCAPHRAARTDPSRFRPNRSSAGAAEAVGQ